MGDGQLDAAKGEGVGAAGVDAGGVGDALLAQPARDLKVADDVSACALRQRRGVGHMVAVPVRRRMKSAASSSAVIGATGLCGFRKGSTTTCTPSASMLKVECPSQVIVSAMKMSSSHKGLRGASCEGR